MFPDISQEKSQSLTIIFQIFLKSEKLEISDNDFLVPLVKTFVRVILNQILVSLNFKLKSHQTLYRGRKVPEIVYFRDIHVPIIKLYNTLMASWEISAILDFKTFSEMPGHFQKNDSGNQKKKWEYNNWKDFGIKNFIKSKSH